jgi:hypothetical protein
MQLEIGYEQQKCELFETKLFVYFLIFGLVKQNVFHLLWCCLYVRKLTSSIPIMILKPHISNWSM